MRSNLGFADFEGARGCGCTDEVRRNFCMARENASR